MMNIRLVKFYFNVRHAIRLVVSYIICQDYLIEAQVD